MLRVCLVNVKNDTECCKMTATQILLQGQVQRLALRSMISMAMVNRISMTLPAGRSGIKQQTQILQQYPGLLLSGGRLEESAQHEQG